jgi:hypothetical protein
MTAFETADGVRAHQTYYERSMYTSGVRGPAEDLRFQCSSESRVQYL